MLMSYVTTNDGYLTAFTPSTITRGAETPLRLITVGDVSLVKTAALRMRSRYKAWVGRKYCSVEMIFDASG